MNPHSSLLTQCWDRGQQHILTTLGRKNKLSCPKTGSVLKLPNDDPDRGQPCIFKVTCDILVMKCIT